MDKYNFKRLLLLELRDWKKSKDDAPTTNKKLRIFQSGVILGLERARDLLRDSKAARSRHTEGAKNGPP